MSYFLPYQQRWIVDDSPLKIYEKSRRVGITYATSYRANRKCLREPQGSSFVQWVSSRDDLTAKEFITDYVAKWAKESNAIARGLDGSNVEVVDEKHGITAYVVRYNNGARICSLSSNPLAFAGKGGDILLDEMDLHLDQATLYAMAYPCITWGNQLEIVSAYDPDGSIESEFAQLCKRAKADNSMGFSLHRTTLTDAIAEGFVEKVNEVKAAKKRPTQTREEFYEQIRRGCLTRSAFETQYMCIPNETSGLQFIEPICLNNAVQKLDCYWGKLEGSNGGEDTLTKPEFWREVLPTGKQYVLGYDVARTGDLSSVWINRLDGNCATLAALVTMHKTRFEKQKKVLAALLKCGITGAGDNTGLGMNICEDLETEFAGSFVGVNFASSKMQLGTLLQSAFEAHNQLIPLQYPEIKADLAAIKKDHTSAGRLLLTVGKNELLPESHGDIAWSCALALYAAQEFAGGPCRMEPSSKKAARDSDDEFYTSRRNLNEISKENRWC